MGTYNLPGPGVFPLALSVLLGAGAAVRIAWLVLRREEDADEVRFGHRNIAAACLALAGVAIFLERAGFLLTAAVFLLVLYRAFSDAGWGKVVLLSTAVVAGFHLLFERLIGSTLPMGVLR